jgi:hypothetical protein
MRKSITSKAAGCAETYLFAEVPSRYIPFRGTFPVVELYQRDKWHEELHGHFYLEDCSEWFQETVAKAQKMQAIEEGFKDFLKTIGSYNDFEKLKASEKSDLLVRYLNANSMTLNYLNI